MRCRSANSTRVNRRFALTIPSAYERPQTINNLLAHYELLDNPKRPTWRVGVEKWASARAGGTKRTGALMGALDGRWRVERLGGFLPPMAGIGKEIRGDRGTVRLGWLRGPSFRVRGHAEDTALVYDRPLSALVDELEAGPGDSWVGRTLLCGCELGRFRMAKVGD
jgi:hypothetical protein